MENAVVYAISGGMFFGKNGQSCSGRTKRFLRFQGFRGIFPLQVNFRKFHLGNLRELSLCCH